MNPTIGMPQNLNPGPPKPDTNPLQFPSATIPHFPPQVTVDTSKQQQQAQAINTDTPKIPPLMGIRPLPPPPPAQLPNLPPAPLQPSQLPPPGTMPLVSQQTPHLVPPMGIGNVATGGSLPGHGQGPTDPPKLPAQATQGDKPDAVPNLGAIVPSGKQMKTKEDGADSKYGNLTVLMV